MSERGMFDQWADKYDRDTRISDQSDAYPFAGYAAVLEEVYRVVCAHQGSTVLDIGVGTGVLTKRLYDQGCQITGVDFSPKMIEIAREKMPRASFIEHDIASGIPDSLEGERFDSIIATYALHHLPMDAHVKIMRGLFRLLAPGGILMVGDISFPTKEKRAACRVDCGDEWDEAEFYFAYDQYRPALGLPSKYGPLSKCAGVLTLRKPRMILFDYGGTLVRETPYDTLRGTEAVLRYATSMPDGLTAEKVAAMNDALFASLEPIRTDHHMELHEHMLMRFLYEYMGIKFSVSNTELECILFTNAAPGILMESVEALLDEIAAQGIRTGIISNIMFSEAALKIRLEMLLPCHRFEFIIASSEYMLRKPHPLLFELALRKAGIDACDVWFCGDRYDCDVQGASGAGITPIWLTKLTEKQGEPTCTVITEWGALLDCF